MAIKTFEKRTEIQLLIVIDIDTLYIYQSTIELSISCRLVFVDAV